MCGIVGIVGKLNACKNALNVLTTSDIILVSGETFYLKGICLIETR